MQAKNVTNKNCLKMKKESNFVKPQVGKLDALAKMVV